MARQPGKPRGVYARHSVLWISYVDAEGKRQRHRTPFRVGQEEQAAKLREAVLRKLRTGDAVAPGDAMPTLAEFAGRWIEQRKTLIASWRNDALWMNGYVLPRLGQLPLSEIKRRHLAELVHELRRAGKLAPKSVHNVYGTLQAMFKAAVRAELVDASPCTLDKYELGPKVDADPEWRATALFARGEVEQLISDERIPPERRMLYALLGLAGLRLGEAAGLRWRHYQLDAEPLGRLVIATSYDKGRTKTQQSREMPVHPTLAAMLAEWRLSGWAEVIGRAPGADDLIAPIGASPNLPTGSMWTKERLQRRRKRDLELLGLRHRRAHDLRRSFISLALEDGARRDLLKRCTHGIPRAEAFDCYVTIGWAALCAEVAKLRVRRREAAEVVALVAAASGPQGPSGPIERNAQGGADASSVTGLVTVGRERPTLTRALRTRPPGLEDGTAIAVDRCSSAFPSASSGVGPPVADSAPAPISVQQGSFSPTCDRCVTGSELLSRALAAIDAAAAALAAGEPDRAAELLAAVRAEIDPEPSR